LAKPIANATNAFNPTCATDGINLFANSLNTHIYHVGIGIEIIAPDVFQDLRSGEDSSRRSHQIFQEIELAGGEFYNMLIAGDFSRDAIELDGSDANQVLAIACTPTYYCMNAGNEFFNEKWFR
jgi:hypothetical protein